MAGASSDAGGRCDTVHEPPPPSGDCRWASPAWHRSRSRPPPPRQRTPCLPRSGRRLNDSKLNRLLNGNLSLFAAGEEREQLGALAAGPLSYLCRWWPPPGRKDDTKRALVAAAAAGAAPEELEGQRLGARSRGAAVCVCDAAGRAGARR